jgi:hypothetical protein
MSGLSQRQRSINGLKRIVSLRQQHAEIRSELGIANVSEDDMDSLLQVTLLVAVTQRYHKPRICRKLHFYGCIMDTNDLFTALAGDEGWLNSDEFRKKFRVTEAAFLHILAMVQDTPTFSNRVNGVLVPKKGPKMKHVGIQLGVFLFYLGSEGKAGSNYNIRGFFKIGRGTANLYRKRVLDALMYLSAKFIKWPDASERADIGQRLGEKHFPLCVGIVDGTIFPLMVKPRRHDACDFFC